MSHPGHSSMAPPATTSSFSASAHQKGKAPPPPAFCMPVQPVPKTEEDRKKRHSTPAGGSLISHAPPQQPHQQNPQHASLALRPTSHNRPAIPEVKFSTTGGVPTYDRLSGPPLQVPSSTASALISPRQLNPHPDSPQRQTHSAPFLAPQPQQPLPRPPRLNPPESSGATGSTRGSRSLSQPPAPSSLVSKTPEQLVKEIESLNKQLQAAQEENLRLAKELAAANRKIEELGGKPKRKKKQTKSLERAKKKEMDKLDREEEKRRKEKEKEDKKEKEEREKREKEEKEKRDKEEKKEKEEREKREKEEKEKKEKEEREEKERKEKEDKRAKKQAKKKGKQATGEEKSLKKKEKKKEKTPRAESNKEEKKAKKKDKKSPRDQEAQQATTETEKKKKGSKRGSKKNKDHAASGEKEVNVGAPKEGAWISTKAATSVELGGADTPPPSREELQAENQRALEIIEGDGKEIFTPEVVSEIDGLVAQEECEVEALRQAISGLERLALVYEKSGEEDLKAKAEKELNEKKNSANLKNYVMANLLNKKARILYSDRVDTSEINTRQEVSPLSLPEPPDTPKKKDNNTSSTPAIPTITTTTTTTTLSPNSGNREPPRPPSFIMPPPDYEPATANILKLSSSSGEEEESTPTYVIGLYPFAGTSTDEVPIKEGDRIRLIEKVSDTWWKGANRGVIGLFPANFVRMEQPNEKPRLAVAIFDRAMKDDPEQLSFKQGDTIRLLDSPGETEEWVKGRLDLDDSVGWLPKAYIQITDS